MSQGSGLGSHTPSAVASDRSILITGGAGYIGSQTAKAAAAAGWKPVVLDNLSCGHRWAAKWGPLEKGDLDDPGFIKQVIDRHAIKAVVHFAAHAYVGESMQNPRRYFRNNVVGTLNLLDAMLDTGVKTIVFSSSCTVYGERISDGPISEATTTEPVNPYGESKLMVEKILRWYEQAYGLSWVALRYFNAAGADPDCEIGEDHDPETHLIPLTIAAALGRLPALGIFGTDYPTPDGTAIRDYIHVADLAEAHLRALVHLEHGGASVALNLGTGQGSSVKEVVAAVERLSGEKVPVRLEPRRAGDPPILVGDARRAAELIGWRPRYSSLDNIVRDALAWAKRHHQGARSEAPALTSGPPDGGPVPTPTARLTEPGASGDGERGG
jgi:UDP-arabinose 4-epimerase